MPTPAPATDRLAPIDALRGLVMVLMAIDHAGYFVTKRHAAEFWGLPLPEFPSGVAFATRFATHLCAPGFFLLMGVGIVLFADSRRRRGWSGARISRFLAVRGLVLILVQQVVENPAWIAAFVASSGVFESYGLEALPGGGSTPFLVFGVLFALGAGLVFWSVAWRLPLAAVLALSGAAMLATQLLTPPASEVERVFHPLVRLLLVPGHSDAWVVVYPIVPWLGAAGLGVALGRLFLRDVSRAWRLAAIAGAVFLGLFAALRLGGGFGNFNPPGPGPVGFLNLTKYPPSLVFLLLTLGANLLLLALLRRIEAGGLTGAWWRWLLVFGRSPLFFYLAHLYVYLLLGLAFPEVGGFGLLYASWAVGLVLLYPLCRWFARFKGSRAPESLWRLL